MANPVPIEETEVRESGQAIQDAQNTTLTATTAATIALLRELLKGLKLPAKVANVQIKMNDSLVFKSNLNNDNPSKAQANLPGLTPAQLSYLKEVVSLPANSNHADLTQDVSITVNNREVFALKDGIVQKNLLVEQSIASSEATQANEVQSLPDNPQPAEISLTGQQHEHLKNIGIDSQALQEVITQKSGTSPIIVVLARELNERLPPGASKNNLQSLTASLARAKEDISRKVSNLVTLIRERFFPAQDIQQDLRNLSVVQTASGLLECYGSQVNGSQVLEGNSFRLERSAKNLSVSAKDGRGTILSLQDGNLSGSLTGADMQKFKAIERQLNQNRSNQLDLG